MVNLKKYNICLVPTTKTRILMDLIEPLKSINKGYCIDKNSIPHVTICQFLSEDTD